MNRITASTIVVASLSMAAVKPAHAALNDHLNEHISAAACRVVNSDDRDLLQFDTTNGSAPGKPL